jgi:hypothetical protein
VSVYLFGVSDQPLGFRLIALVDLDWSRVAPTLWRCVDGLAPRTQADAVLTNLGGGQFSAMLSAGDTSGDFVSFQLEADNCIADEKTILPFRSSSLPFSITVEDWPVTTAYPGTTHLAFDPLSAFSLSQPLAGTVEVQLGDAAPNVRGLVSAGFQSFTGTKHFQDSWQSGVYLAEQANNTLFDDSGGYTLENASYLYYNIQVNDSSFVPRATFNLLNDVGYPDTFRLTKNDAGGAYQDANYSVVDSAGIIRTGIYATVDGLVFAGGLYTAGSLAPAWSSITGTPTTLAGYGLTSPLDIAEGGTGLASAPILGDLLGGGAGTWGLLSVGTNGDVLTADSTQTLGLRWGAAPGAYAPGAPADWAGAPPSTIAAALDRLAHAGATATWPA